MLESTSQQKTELQKHKQRNACAEKLALHFMRRYTNALRKSKFAQKSYKRQASITFTKTGMVHCVSG